MEQNRAIENYSEAIRAIAEYAPDLSAGADDAKAPERGYLREIADQIAQGDATVLEESRSYVRCVLREYRDQSAEYLGNLRQDLASTAATLSDVSRTLAESDSASAPGFTAGLSQLQELASMPAARMAAQEIADAAADLETGLADVRKHHQLIVSQLHTEIRLLQRRMEALTAAGLDDMSRLMPREEIEDRMAVAAQGAFRLLLLKARGLNRAKLEQPARVFDDLSTAFTRRLRNNLPHDSLVGRWTEEGFVAIVFAGVTHARELGQILARRLSGPYVCRSEAKTVITTLETSVEILEPGRQNREEIIKAIDNAL
jgi:GGDEF domain-containing protein